MTTKAPKFTMAALVGGWDGKHELASAKLLVFDDSRKGMQWLQIPELPAPTAGTVKVVVDADMPSPVKADSDEDCSSTDDDSD